MTNIPVENVSDKFIKEYLSRSRRGCRILAIDTRWEDTPCSEARRRAATHIKSPSGRKWPTALAISRSLHVHSNRMLPY